MGVTLWVGLHYPNFGLVCDGFLLLVYAIEVCVCMCKGLNYGLSAVFIDVCVVLALCRVKGRE